MASTTEQTGTRREYLDLNIPWCLNDEHHAWRRSVRAFAEDVVGPGAGERDANHRFDVDLMSRVAELGLFGLRVSPQYGGTGADLTSFCLAIEELARVDSSVAVTVHVAGISAALLEQLATHEQKRELLPIVASGAQIMSFGLTEPASGSDAGNMRTRARRDGGDWILNGAKVFITNAGYASHVIVFATTEVGVNGRPRASAFLVPMDADGFTIGEPYSKMGWRSSDTRPLFFDDVRLPGDALLGESGTGFAEALRFLTWARLPIAAMSVGLSQACVELTREFLCNRESFGKRLSEHQHLAFALADMAAMTATARTVTYDACFKHDHGHPFDQEAAICKYVASEIAHKVSAAATQLHGGYGFVEESAVTRHFRDARILTIGEGTSEVQLMLIARTLGLDV